MSERLKKGWPRVTFGDVVQLCRERSGNPEDDRFKRYVGLEHLDPGDLKIRRWGDVANGTTFSNIIRAGQVLFGKRRAYQRKVAVANFDGVCSGDIYVFEPKNEQLLPELLPFICQSDGFFEHAVGTSAGSLSPRTNWDSLAGYEFALPPLEEQRRIHSLLVIISHVVESLTNCLEGCKRMVVAMRTSYFDPARTEPVLLARLCGDSKGIQIGPFGAQLHQSDYQENGVPVIMPINMQDDRIIVDGIARISAQKAQSLAIHRVQEGDIILPRRGELDRRVYIDSASTGWICGTGSIRIRLRRPTDSLAVYHALASLHTVRWLTANAVGTTMPNLNTKIVGNIPIAIPRQDLVKDVLTTLSSLDAQIIALRNRLQLAYRLRQHTFNITLGVD